MRRTTTIRLTADNVRTLALPHGKAEAIHWDSDIPGFGLRVRQGGSRKLIFAYEFAGSARKMTLGEATADFPAARAKAKKYYGRVIDGRDPKAERDDAKRTSAETFKAHLAEYLAYQRDPQGGGRRARYCRELERNLLGHAEPLHSKALAAIEARDVAALAARVASGSGRDAARMIRAAISSYLNFAVGEGLLDRNPVVGTNKYRSQARDRVLTAGELRAVWSGVGEGQFGAIVRLLMLTGARANEIAALRWTEIDLELAVISLPPERTKNGRPHEIPLSLPAAAILAAWPRGDAKRDLVFGNSLGPFSGWSKSKAALDARIDLPPWRIHDLRRSVSTHAHEIGIEPHIVEALLGHAGGHKSGVAGTYNHALYRNQKRTASDRWADWLMAAVEGRASNVVTLGAAS